MTDQTTVPEGATETDEKEKAKPRAFFVNDKGEFSRNPGEDTVAVRCEYKEFDNVQAAVSEFPENIRPLLAWHGLKQLMGDARASEKKVGEEQTNENLVTRLERLMGGEWVKEGEGAGPRPSLIADALKAALEEAGETVDEERYNKNREKLKDPQERKAAMAIPQVKAHYDRLQAERAAERARKSQAAAAEAGAEGLANF